MCAQVYGKKQIVMERDEVDAIKRFEDPGLYLIGFKPLKMLKTHHHIHPAVFIYPEEDMVKGRVVCALALVDIMHRTSRSTAAVESAQPALSAFLLATFSVNFGDVGVCVGFTYVVSIHTSVRF